MLIQRFIVGFILGLTTLGTIATAADYDLVLKGGRVIDPETGLDGIRDLAIKDGRIAAISADALTGDTEIDVKGQVVAPGFIDLHTHSPTPLGQKFQVMDGVTTALELESGAFPVAEYGNLIRDKALYNYGASVGYGSIRLEVKMGLAKAHMLAGDPSPINFKGYRTAFRSLYSEPREVYDESASEEEREQIRARIVEGIKQGGIGIGLPLDYISDAVDPKELRMIFEVSAQHNAPIFVHIRRGNNGDPAGLYEMLDLAKQTGAAVHICHISHNAMRKLDLFLTEIRKARAEGVDITTEVIPYNAGSTTISAAVFGRDWQTVFGITYKDVEWSETGERFNKATWEEYQEKYPQGFVIHHYLKEEWTRKALAEPGVMVVSDLVPIMNLEKKVVPHIGTFSKVLGRYVRDEKLLDLKTALAKMTLLPAQRLEKIAPLFKLKGRLQVGADADITVFSPDIVSDRATYMKPYQPSVGINQVIINGELVVRDGVIIEGVYPGKALFGGKE